MQTLYFQVIIKQTEATLMMNVSWKIALDKQSNVVSWAKRDGWQSIQNKQGIILLKKCFFKWRLVVNTSW